MTQSEDPIVLEDFLPYRLTRLAEEISRQLRKVYKAEHALTVPEWRSLATLGQFGTVTARAIGVHACMHKTKVSRAVAALEDRRWISRDRNPDDRREDFLSLTGPGRHAYDRLLPGLRAFESAITDRFAETAGTDPAIDLSATLEVLERVLGIEDAAAAEPDERTEPI